MTFEHLKVEVADGVALVTVNRPEKLNALNTALVRQLGECFAALKRDAAVRVVVLTGAGEKAFVAGADIAELSALAPIDGGRTSAAGQATFTAIERLGKPVIAAINGYALGGGLELAMACTLRTAAKTAKLGLPEITLGIIPGYGGTQRLPRLVGLGRANELMLRGAPISADEAWRIGLVNHVFEPAELLPKTLELAKDLATRAPIATRFILDAANSGGDLGLDQGQAHEAALFGWIMSTADTKEGLKAFVEKRKPQWRGV